MFIPDGLDCVHVNHVHLPRGCGACFPTQILGALK